MRIPLIHSNKFHLLFVIGLVSFLLIQRVESKAATVKTKRSVTCDPPNHLPGVKWVLPYGQQSEVYFFLSPRKANWTEANNYCQKFTTDQYITNLARIDAAVENYGILRIIQETSKHRKIKRKLWVSGKTEDMITWNWDQRTQLERSIKQPIGPFTHWGPDEPQTFRMRGEDHNCMAFVAKKFGGFSPSEWMTRNCKNREWFVCEYRCSDNFL